MLKKQSKVAFVTKVAQKLEKEKQKVAEQIVESPKRDPHSQKEQTESKFSSLLQIGAILNKLLLF